MGFETIGFALGATTASSAATLGGAAVFGGISTAISAISTFTQKQPKAVQTQTPSTQELEQTKKQADSDLATSIKARKSAKQRPPETLLSGARGIEDQEFITNQSLISGRNVA